MDDNLFQLCFTKQTDECEISSPTLNARHWLTNSARWDSQKKNLSSLKSKSSQSAMNQSLLCNNNFFASNSLSPVLSITVAEIEALICAADIQFFSLVFATSQKNIMFPSRFVWCTGHYTSQRVNQNGAEKKRRREYAWKLKLARMCFFLLWRIY